MRINENRLLQDLNDLAEIGATPEGGVTRTAFSEEDLLGRRWFADRLRDANLSYSVDGAGNQSGLLVSGLLNAKRLLLGSHLDTVPNGGRYDGALGTLAALETARTIQENFVQLPFNLEVINFTDEEGTMMGEFGSEAFTGSMTEDQLDRTRGGQDVLAEGMNRLGITRESVLEARRNPNDYIGFLELHVEQGERLEKRGLDIGVVTGVVGIRSFWIRFVGEAAHAGTMPVAQRKDAFQGASGFIMASREMAINRFFPGVVNCGIASVSPGAFNIVPAEVKLSLEFRHGSEAELDQMEHALLALAKQTAARFGLGLEIERLDVVRSAPAAERIMRAFEAAADECRLSHARMLSFAGHDTQSMCRFTPGGMIFVPSVNGISHNPKEYTRSEDCINGANVLLQAVLKLAKRYS